MDTESVAARLRAIRLPPRKAAAQVPVEPALVLHNFEQPLLTWEGRRAHLAPIAVRRRHTSPQMRRQPETKSLRCRTNAELVSRWRLAAAMDAARASLPMHFLVSHNQHRDVASRRLNRATRLGAKAGKALVNRAWRRWRHVCESMAARRFLERTITSSRQQAASFLMTFLTRRARTSLRQGLRKWRLQTRHIRRALRDGLKNQKARLLQAWMRPVLDRQRSCRRSLEAAAQWRRQRELRVSNQPQMPRSESTVQKRHNDSNAMHAVGFRAVCVSTLRTTETGKDKQHNRNESGHQQHGLRKSRRDLVHLTSKKVTSAPSGLKAVRENVAYKEVSKECNPPSSSKVTTVSGHAVLAEVEATGSVSSSAAKGCHVDVPRAGSQIDAKKRPSVGATSRIYAEAHEDAMTSGIVELQRRGIRYVQRKKHLALTLQRLQRRTVRRGKQIKCDAAGAAVAAAVAAQAKLLLPSSLSVAEREEEARRKTASSRLQSSVRRRRLRLSEKRIMAATLVQRQWRRKAATNEIKARRTHIETERARMRAARRLARAWLVYRQRRALSMRIEVRSLYVMASRRDFEIVCAASLCVRWYRRELLRRAVKRRCRVHQARVAVETRIAIRATNSLRIAMTWRRLRRREIMAQRSQLGQQSRRVRTSALSREHGAAIIGAAWRGCTRRYNQPVRIIARGRVQARRLFNEKSEAAAFIQKSWRRRDDMRKLERKCGLRRLRHTVIKSAQQRIDAANSIHRGFEFRRDRLMLQRLRQKRRVRIDAEASEAAHNAAAAIMCRFARRWLFMKILTRRFGAASQRLARERANRRYVQEARAERDEAEHATDVAVKTLELVKLAAWKLGSDAAGENYYYNWVTGESSYERPEGWTPSEADIWVKNFDNKGNVFYYNQLTQASAWFPPCSRCGKAEARRVCFDCGHLHFCEPCFDREHSADDPIKSKHTWRGADADKEELESGERHCIVCQSKKATLMCSDCRPDVYCNECFRTSHTHGRLADHSTVLFDEARKGWQLVEGRVAGEQTYYFHATTGESTHEKPEALMLKDELFQHRRFKEFEHAANKYCAQVDKLQIEIERLKYEKDTTMFAQAKEREAERAELEELRALLMQDQSKPGRLQRYKAIWNGPIEYYIKQRDANRRKKQLYRKMLLLNKKQRENMLAFSPTVAPVSVSVESPVQSLSSSASVVSPGAQHTAYSGPGPQNRAVTFPASGNTTRAKWAANAA